MAENTLQFDWIMRIAGGLRSLFARDPRVFVAGDLFWYPVQGHPEICIAPDAMVVFGRPPGHRGSYRQWEEDGIAPQVVFEVRSPSNRIGDLMTKFEFYLLYGVEEYYLYDPDPSRLELTGFTRRGNQLIEVPNMNGYISPRLKVKFHMQEDGLQIIRPDGEPFLTTEEALLQRDEARLRAQAAEDRAAALQAELDRLRQSKG